MMADISSSPKIPRGSTCLDFSKKINGFDKVLSLSTLIRVNNTAESIDISHNKINDEWLKILCNGIRQNETLRILKLNDNDISNKGVSILFDALKEKPSKIFVLTLSSKYAFIHAIIYLVPTKDNKIDDDGFSTIVESLKTNTVLRKIIINSNNIGIEGIKSICGLIGQNDTLEYLSITSNNITKEEELSFIKYLRKNASQPISTQGYDDGSNTTQRKPLCEDFYEDDDETSKSERIEETEKEKEKENGSAKKEDAEIRIVTAGVLRIFFGGSEELERKLLNDEDAGEADFFAKRGLSSLSSSASPVVGPTSSAAPLELGLESAVANKFNLRGVYNEKTEKVDVTWDPLPDRTTENDSIGLYIYNREKDGSFYSSFYVRDCEPGSSSCSLKAPKRGFCELRYFDTLIKWKYVEKPCISRSERFLIGPEVSLAAKVEDETGVITVYWDRWPEIASGYDWVGLYKVSTKSNRSYVESKYVSDSKISMVNGSEVKCLEFKRPRVSGTYEFRFFFYVKNTSAIGHFCSGYSSSFEIKNVDTLSIEMSADEKSFYVKYCCPSSEPNNNDWIGVYASPKCANNKFITYKYCSDKGRNKVLNSGAELFEKLLGKYTPKDRESWEIRFISNNKVVARTMFVQKK